MYCHLQGNQNSSRLQCKVAYSSALAVSSAAQLAAAHCTKEEILDSHKSAGESQNLVCRFAPASCCMGIHILLLGGVFKKIITVLIKKSFPVNIGKQPDTKQSKQLLSTAAALHKRPYFITHIPSLQESTEIKQN